MRATLSLRKDTLTELTSDDLANVVGGTGETCDAACLLRAVTIEPNWTQVTW